MANTTTVSKKPNKATSKDWAFLAYIAGDNNLSDAGLEDIEEMCKEGTNAQLYAGVQIDTFGEHEGSIRYEITEKDWTGKAHRTVISRLEESDSGNPVVLKNFVDWGLSRYPASKVLAVIWNHGSGFRSVRRDIAYDDFGSSLDMPEIELAFARAFKRAKMPASFKISVLGFDACLMNMIEIAHHLAGQVEVLVGSQQTEPGDGWPYDAVLSLMKQPLTPANLGKRIVDVYIADYKKRGETGVTQSAIELSKTETAVKALGAFGKSLVATLPATATAIRTARLRAQAYQMSDYVDLVDAAAQISAAVPSVAAQASALIAATKNCVLSSKTYGSSVRNSNGLSVWFPSEATTYFNYRPKYLALKSSAVAPGWVAFLDKYFS
jgi:hypothetical protein